MLRLIDFLVKHVPVDTQVKTVISHAIQPLLDMYESEDDKYVFVSIYTLFWDENFPQLTSTLCE